MSVVHLYFTRFASTDAMAATTSKDHVRALVQLEKAASRGLQTLAIAQTLGVSRQQVHIQPVRVPDTSSQGAPKSSLSVKPWHAGVQFNTSNEAGAVVVAVCGGAQTPLGVDLIAEKPAGDSPGAAGGPIDPESTDFDTLDAEYLRLMMLTASELEAVKRMPTKRLRQRVYALIISAKEAFLKYHGVGLVGVSSFADVEVDLSGAAPALTPAADLEAAWLVARDQNQDPAERAPQPAIRWIENVSARPLHVDFVAAWRPRFDTWAAEHQADSNGDFPEGTRRAVARLFKIHDPRAGETGDAPAATELLGAVVGPRFPAPAAAHYVEFKDVC